MRSAKKKRALTEMNSIKVAIQQFYNELKYMPWPSQEVEGRTSWVGEDVWTSGNADQEEVMLLLTGDNMKGTVYLQIPEKSRPEGNPQPMVFLDPWGQAYRIGLDRDADRTVAPDSVVGGAPVKEQVLVYSLGDPVSPEILKTFTSPPTTLGN